MLTTNRIEMKTISVFAFSLLIGFIAVFYCFQLSFFQYLDNYAIRAAQVQLGCSRLQSEQEEKIKSIALKMGIKKPLIIRKMNTQALLQYGYYNAFVYFYKLFNVIPISTQPFVFVSEGFLEDISTEEQLFIIGHELVHAQQQHRLYLDFIFYMVLVVLFVVCFLLRNPLYLFFSKYLSFEFIRYAWVLLFALGMFANSYAFYAYLRAIEREADAESIAQLHSYDGGIKLIDRWVRDFRMPLHNQGLDWFIDHPSHFERKTYFLSCKKNHEKDL